MSATTDDLLGVVHSDGSLELAGKLTVAPGRVRVRVESLERQPQPAESLIEFVRRTHSELESCGHQFLTGEEAMAWVEELRADDDHIEEAYQRAMRKASQVA